MSAPFPPEPVGEEIPQEPAPQTPYWSYQDLLLFAALAIPCLLAGAILMQIVAWVLPFYPKTKAATAIPAQFIAYGLWFGCLYLLLKTKYDQPFWPSMSWNVNWRDIVWGLFWGPAVAVIVSAIGLLLRTPDIEMPMKELLSDRASVVLMGIFAATLGPLCEELAFRGFLMPLLARSAGQVAAVILAALPFALLHGPQYGWSWRHVMLILLAGVAFGWIRYRTGSTAAATAVHGTYNLTFLVSYFMHERNF